ncbi:hypothetical protein BH09BAC1_BH09BAC1_05770 [soil metagenome]
MKPPIWVNILVSALIGMLVLLAYHKHFDNDFHFDDSHTIEGNIYIRDLGNIPSYFASSETFSSLTLNQSYRPIVTTTLAIDYWVGKTFFDNGLNPTPYHITNFGWFLFQVVLMVFLFKAILDKVKPHDWNLLISILLAGWYGVHTVNAETVNYIIARSDILSTVGVVGAMLIYISNGWGKKSLAYLIPFALGMLAKPSAIMFLPILGVYIFLFEWQLSFAQIFKAFKKDYLEEWSHLIVVAVISVGGYWFMRRMEPQWIPGGTSPIDYLITQPYVIWHYFKMLFLPTQLTADTDLKAFSTIADPRFFAGLLFVAAMLFMAIATSLYKHLRPVSFGILWFFLALIPTSSIIPLSEVMNDHRMYFPFIGLMLATGWPIALWIMSRTFAPIQSTNAKTKIKQKRFEPRPWVAQAAVVGCLVFFSGLAYGSYQRSEVWDSEESLWHDVTIKSPENGRGWMNYGLVFMSRGEYAKALELYQTALKYSPNYAYLYINMAITYEQLGKQDMALKNFEYAKQYGDFFPEVHFHYGNWLYRQKRYGDAKFELRKTIQMSPGHGPARYALMQLHFENQEKTELRKLAEETLQVLPGDERTLAYLNGIKTDNEVIAGMKTKAETEPNEANYLNLSLTYYNMGQFQACIEAAYKALEYKPDLAEAYNNICSAHNEMKQWDLAISACNKALQIKPDYALAKNNLNWALGQKGK